MKVADYGAQERESLQSLNKEEGLPFSLAGIKVTKHMPCSTGSFSFGICTSGRMSSFMEMHPCMWSKEDVSVWLDWCRKEYALSDVSMEKFSMNGKALCVLTKEDFKERAPNVGDVLFNTLQQFASTNLHPSLRNGLPHLFPQMATSSGLLMPAAAAATMCNTFIPAAHLQHLLGQVYPAPMTPESSPSAPSVSSNSTPPRTVTPVNHDLRPTILVTQPSEERVQQSTAGADKIPVGVLEIEPRTPSPNNARSVHSSLMRPSPVDHYNRQNQATITSIIHKQDHYQNHREGLPVLQKEHVTENGAKNTNDEPLNLSRRPSESAPTPSPPLLTPHVKPEPPPMPGAGLQAALRAYLPRNINSTTGLANRQFLTVPGAHLAPTASPPSVPVVIQKINQSGGEMTVSPDPKFAVNHYSSVQDLVKNIKKEPESELSEIPHQQQHHLTPLYRGSPLLVESPLVRQKVSTPVTTPHTPNYDPISPCDDEDTDLETPFSPPITPGGTLLGFAPGTPNGAISPGRSDGTGKLLWEFLSELLNDQIHQSDPKPIVKWIDMNTYTFQILDTQRLSSLWGQQKNRGTMNYEKLSRALRYYKKVGIIEKATGKRLTYKFMKPPSSIKRGQRGARPGVPRKHRRQSVLQSQQSVNEEINAPQKDVGDQTPTTSSVSTPYAIAHMPQFMASGTMKTQLHHVISQRTEAAMALAGMSLPSGNVAMLAGLPIVVPPSSSLNVNGSINGSPAPQYLANSFRSSPKAAAKSPETDDTTGNAKYVSEQSTSDSDREASMGEKSGDEAGNAKDETNSSDMIKQSDEEKYFPGDNSNKAVHLGMPITVPTYNSNTKAKSRLLLNSLSKRRLMSSGDGSTPKKMPRLILPKQTEKVNHMNNNNYISEETDAVH